MLYEINLETFNMSVKLIVNFIWELLLFQKNKVPTY